MLEREIERNLREKVTRAGGLCLKFVSPGWAGAPDRLCLFPDGKMAFVELKRPGAKPRPLQSARHRQLRKLGFSVYVVDRPEQIQDLMGDIAKDGGGGLAKT